MSNSLAIKCRRKLETTIQKLKLDPMKRHSYFRVSVGELDGTALSTGSMFAEELDVATFNVKSSTWQHDFDCSEFQDSLIRLQTTTQE